MTSLLVMALNLGQNLSEKEYPEKIRDKKNEKKFEVKHVISQILVSEECRKHNKHIYNKAIQHNDPHINTCHPSTQLHK